MYTLGNGRCLIKRRDKQTQEIRKLKVMRERVILKNPLIITEALLIIEVPRPSLWRKFPEPESRSKYDLLWQSKFFFFFQFSEAHSSNTENILVLELSNYLLAPPRVWTRDVILRSCILKYKVKCMIIIVLQRVGFNYSNLTLTHTHTQCDSWGTNELLINSVLL